MNSLSARLLALTLTAASLPLAAQTTVTKAPFGKTTDGTAADLYTLSDSALKIRITNYGAHIVSIEAPDRSGNRTDVILGYDTLDGFLKDTTYMGSVVGRYGNRIAKGTFPLAGNTYHITLNNNGNMLHGGKSGFDKKVWVARQIPNGVELTVTSPDGDQGFPGTLIGHIRYTLVGDKLHLDYSATTDKPTVLNLTNHTYFNLAGKGDILHDTIMINADRYTPVDAQLIPNGQLAPVAGTPFDLNKPTVIGDHVKDNNEQIKLGSGGYDHNFVLNSPRDLTKPAARVVDPTNGRVLTVYTTEPGVQFYTGNSLDGTFTGVGGENYSKYHGLCLETQHFPDSPNHPSFPSVALLPGQTMHSSTIFQFTTQK